MRNKIIAFGILAATIAMDSNASKAEEVSPPLRICILSGCLTYHSEDTLPPFQKELEELYNVRCVRVTRAADDDMPGLDALERCDVALIFMKRMSLKGDQLDRFKKYAASGRPIVAVRTASHGVQTWLEFDREVLGGNYHGHYEVGLTTKINRVASKDNHPILSKVELEEGGDALYKNDGHADDIDVLLTGSVAGEPVQPLAWTREYKGGRIFYTSLGAESTFATRGFRRMVANALFWVARRDVEVRSK